MGEGNYLEEEEREQNFKLAVFGTSYPSFNIIDDDFIIGSNANYYLVLDNFIYEANPDHNRYRKHDSNSSTDFEDAS